MRRFVLAIAISLIAIGLASCAESSTEPGTIDCPERWTYMSQQGWKVDFADGPTSRQIPDRTGSMVHNHIEGCAPIDVPVFGSHLDLELKVMVHKLAGRLDGDRLDIGLGPGGKTLAETPIHVPCGEEPAACHGVAKVRVPLDGLNGRVELRPRYLRATLNGERVFSSGSWNICVRTCAHVEDQSRPAGYHEARWWTADTDDYVRARWMVDLSQGPPEIHGQWWRPEIVVQDAHRAFVHVDALFGEDNYGRTVFEGSGNYRGPVSIPLGGLAPGLHCAAVRADRVTDTGTEVAIMQIPFTVGDGGGEQAGLGGCGPGTGGV
jgi:hypothetical protein